jgi:hypothetical protein
MNSAVTILVVDDEPAIRRLLHASLARAAYRVVEAGSARETLAALQIDKPEVVLLDLGLRDRDGLELIPLIKVAGAAVIVVPRAMRRTRKWRRWTLARTISWQSLSTARKCSPASARRCGTGWRVPPARQCCATATWRSIWRRAG